MSSAFDKYAARVAPPRSSSTVVVGGNTPFGLSLVWWAVFIVLFILKLGVGDTKVEDWSWWLVTAPLWGPWAFAVVLTLFLAPILLIIDAFRS